MEKFFGNEGVGKDGTIYKVKEVPTCNTKTQSFIRKRKKGVEIAAARGGEAAMDNKSITVCVHVSALAQRQPLIFDKFESSDTVGIVKNMVQDLVFQKPIQPDFLPLHPAISALVSSGRVLEEDQNLVSLSESCGSNVIHMHYLRDPHIDSSPDLQDQLNFLGLTKSARFIEEPNEGSHFKILCPKDEDEDEYGYEDEDEDEDEKPKPVPILKRPKTIHGPLPSINLGGLGICGPYELFGSKNRIIPLSRFKFAHSIKTTADVILLAPNPEIFQHLVSLYSKSDYLVLHVCWDMLSYFFLRTLRTSYPDIPIVAVTDLDPHHLDLLTFLDTPPDVVLSCYGWNFSGDSDDDEVCKTNIDFVNIGWLGLCPNDCEGLHFDDDARPAPLPGFDEVIRMLRVNPFLRRKEDWLAALDWLDLYGKSVSFHLGGDFISRKLSKKDWV